MIDPIQTRAWLTDTIDADECAQLLKCTPEQVETLARDGDIPGLKIGRGWLFIRADLLVYLAERARAEAQARRERRAAPAQGPSNVQPIKSRRSAPPVLTQAGQFPQLPRTFAGPQP